MKRSAILVMLAAVAACGGGVASSSTTQAVSAVVAVATTTTAPATTTTAEPTTTTLSVAAIAEAELQADAALIANLYRNYSDSWFQGVDTAYEFLAAHNHPSMECTVDDYETHYGFLEGTLVEDVVHQDTVQRHDEWILPDTGEVPDGRIYVYQMTSTFDDPEFEPSEELLEVHAAIIDGQAFFFIACREVT